jgi:hypothetical protein
MSVFSFVAGAAMVLSLLRILRVASSGPAAENRTAGNSTKLMIVTLQGAEDEI